MDEAVRAMAIGAMAAGLVLVAGYRWVAVHNHHRGHRCVYDTLEHHDPLLLALVLVVLHQRRVIELPDLPETVAWMVHRHKLYGHASVLDDHSVHDYLQRCYQELGRKVANRITERTKLGQWG